MTGLFIDQQQRYEVLNINKPSGVMWPIQKPWEPPLKRPSVNRATQSPKPAPIIALRMESELIDLQ